MAGVKSKTTEPANEIKTSDVIDSIKTTDDEKNFFIRASLYLEKSAHALLQSNLYAYVFALYVAVL